MYNFKFITIVWFNLLALIALFIGYAKIQKRTLPLGRVFLFMQ